MGIVEVRKRPAEGVREHGEEGSHFSIPMPPSPLLALCCWIKESRKAEPWAVSVHRRVDMCMSDRCVVRSHDQLPRVMPASCPLVSQ